LNRSSLVEILATYENGIKCEIHGQFIRGIHHVDRMQYPIHKMLKFVIYALFHNKLTTNVPCLGIMGDSNLM
jgi:hypothetical protein